MRLKILKLSLLSVSTVIKFVYIYKTALVLTFKCLVLVLDCKKEWQRMDVLILMQQFSNVSLWLC